MLCSIIPTIKPEYLLSGLASSTDVNNRNDSHQSPMNDLGMERGHMRNQPGNQSSGKAMAKLARKTAAAASTLTKTPVIVTLTQHIIFPIGCRTGSRPDSTMPAQPLLRSTVILCGRPARYLTIRTFLAHSRRSHGPAGRIPPYLQQSPTTEHATTSS